MILRLSFAGQITKAETKQVGEKTLIEVSLCKKHKGRNGGEDTFTWIRVNVWEPADFQVPKLVKGAFIAGSGEFQLRSFEGKDGSKQVSAECRSSSFDIEVTDGTPREVVNPHFEPTQRTEPKVNVQMSKPAPYKAALNPPDAETTPF